MSIEVNNEEKKPDGLVLAEPQPPSYDKKIIIGKDRLEASLGITSVRGWRRYYLNSDKDNPVPLHRDAPFIFEEYMLEDILNELKLRGIVYGIDNDRIREAFNTPDKFVVVAKGQPAIPTVDEKITCYFPTEKANVNFETILQSPDEPFKPLHLTIVKYGDLLLIKDPAIKGTAGINIFGEPIEVKPPKIKQIVPAMDGSVSVTQDGLTVKAGIAGIPSFDGVNIKVKPILEIDGDADPNTTGSIDFPGTVIVKGSVNGKINIWANQKIDVQKDVIQGSLDAEESINVDSKVIGARLIAGGEAAACVKIIPYVEHIIELMMNVMQAFNEFITKIPGAHNYEDKKIFIQLMYSVTPEMPDKINEIWEILANLRRLNPKRSVAIKSILANIINIEKRKADRKEFVGWIADLAQILEKLKLFESVTYDIHLKYAQLANIATSGTIFVTDEGCYNSHLLAGRDIIINGNPGYFREGHIKAKGKIFVKELGSPNGSKTVVEVPEKGVIAANLVHSGVTIKLGEKEHHFLQEFYNLNATLDEEGNIKFTK